MPSALKHKVVLIGDANVGKTSLLNKLINNYYNKDYSPTVGTNFSVWTSSRKSDSISLQIWDTAGEEKYKSLGTIFYRNADAALLIYSQSDPNSAKNLESWLDCFRKVAGDDTCVTVIANKSDLKKTDQKEIKEWASKHELPFYETSACTGEGVIDAFNAVANTIGKKFAFPELTLNPYETKLVDTRTQVQHRYTFLC